MGKQTLINGFNVHNNLISLEEGYKITIPDEVIQCMQLRIKGKEQFIMMYNENHIVLTKINKKSSSVASQENMFFPASSTSGLLKASSVKSKRKKMVKKSNKKQTTK